MVLLLTFGLALKEYMKSWHDRENFIWKNQVNKKVVLKKNFNLNDNTVYEEGMTITSPTSTIVKILVLEDSPVILIKYTSRSEAE